MNNKHRVSSEWSIRPEFSKPPAPWWRFSKKARITIYAVLLACICFYEALWYLSIKRYPPTRNRVLIGKEGSSKPLAFQFIDPARLPISDDDLIMARRNVVGSYETLFAAPYEPYGYVFGAARSPGHPWIASSQLFIARDQEVKDRRAAAGRIILNPLILVYPEFTSLTVGNAAFKWSQGALQSQLDSSSLPLYPSADVVEWYPAERRAEVRFDITKFLNELNPWLESPLSPADLSFSVVALNAVDFGFRAIAMRPAENQGITQIEQPEAAIIGDRLVDVGGLCPKVSSCLHYASSLREYSRIKVASLPARVVFDLWKNLPKDLGQAADLRFSIVIQ